MFKRFEPSEISTSTQVKASVQRHLRAQIADAHPGITEEQWDVLLPKKQPLVQYKVGPHLMLYCQRVERNDEDGISSPTDGPAFFQHRDGPILPVLRLVHKYPTLRWTSVTVDRGAIPYLLGGANVMAPGLTKPGRSVMPPDGIEKDPQGFDLPGLARGDGVVIRAEGKDHAIGVGVMAATSAEM
jgi:malignant T-cell-amplified sequence